MQSKRLLKACRSQVRSVYRWQDHNKDKRRRQGLATVMLIAVTVLLTGALPSDLNNTKLLPLWALKTSANKVQQKVCLHASVSSQESSRISEATELELGVSPLAWRLGDKKFVAIFHHKNTFFCLAWVWHESVGDYHTAENKIVSIWSCYD